MTSLRARRILATTAVLPIVLAVGACSASVSAGGYDPDEVAKKVQDAQQDVTPDLDVTDPTCPDDEPEEGATIECSVTIDGVEAPYAVTFTEVTDDNAKFDIEPAQAIISVDKVVDFLQGQAADQGLGEVDVDCGEAAVLVQEPDSTFTCTLVQGADTQDVTLRVTDLDGNVTLEG
jgi:hypothetical protein